MELSEQIHTLLEHYNRPERPQLSATAALIEGCSDPYRAWERLSDHGILLPDFLSDGRRRYAQHSEGTSIRASDRPPELNQPSSLRAVFNVAADLQGLLKAESCARELAKRLS